MDRNTCKPPNDAKRIAKPDFGSTVLIGEALRAMYNRVVIEDVPDHLTDLLLQLEAAEQH